MFDLDGTLVDSLWIWKDIDIEFLGKHGLELPEDLQPALDGMSFYETAVYMKERFSLPETPEELMDIWNDMAKDKYAKEVPLKKGVKEFLQKLKKEGIKTGVASSNSILLIETTLKANGVYEYFDSIHSANEVAKGKPAPDIYELVAKELKVQPKDCLVFEDIVMGIMAGKSAQMETCAVYDEHSAQATEEKKKLADHYIMDYTELL